MNGETPLDLAETMGLSRELLERVAHRTHQWGNAIARGLEDVSVPDSEPIGNRQQELRRREAASLFTIAGSYRLLLGARRDDAALETAGRHYRVLGDSFAHPIAVCARDTRAAYAAVEDVDRPLGPADRANILLALSWVDSGSRNYGDEARTALHAHLRLARSAAADEVGRLRVPLGALLRVIEQVDLMHHDGANNMRALTASVHDFLIRAHDVTAAAMSDRFHWRMLMSSVLPVEPEAAALGASVMAATMGRQSDDELLKRLNLPRQALAPLLVGRAIAGAE